VLDGPARSARSAVPAIPQMTTVSLSSSGSRDRAIDALERAAIAAETGFPDRPITVVGEADLDVLTPADVRSRLDRVVLGGFPEAGLDGLLASGALDRLLPELGALVGFGDGEWRHKDVWKHTKQVVAQAELRLEVRYAALFHDIGKVKTRSISPEGEVHFFGHAEVGARMFDKLERRQRLFSGQDSLRESIRSLVLHHLRASQYDGQWTDSAVRRFAREMGARLDDLLCLSRADITTKRIEKRRRGVGLINELAERITQLAAQDAEVPALPKGVGTEIMATFGLTPCKLVGDIKRALEGAVDTGELESHRESAYYVEYVAAHRSRFGLT
jgi:poly(A) polymerase